MPSRIFSPQGIEKAAVEVAGVLRALANERRLVVLCKLGERGEANVNSLAETVGLSKLDEAKLALDEGRPVIFHCESGARTAGNASRLAQKVDGGCEAFVLEGGLDAWKKAGLPL